MTSTQLSPHFTLGEFASHDGHPVPASKIHDVRRLCDWWLEPFRREFGPTRVASGYRTRAHNDAVGGARRSVHLLGTMLPASTAAVDGWAAAADVVASRGGPVQWARWAQEHRRKHPHLGPRGRGGIGRYIGQGFVHLDTATARDWQG